MSEDRSIFDEMKKLSGQYPDGKLNDNDQGSLDIAVTHEDGRVMVQFQQPVTWVGLTADGAVELASLLIKHARKANRHKPLVFTVGDT